MNGFSALAVALLASCGDPPARVTLVPLDIGECGRPSNANQLTITAFAEGGEVKKAVALDRTVDIGDFPDDTVQLGVEILVGGGETGAAGKTLPLAFADLPDGAAIPIAMVPPGGFCPVGPLGEARRQPLVARAGDGVLVAGGVGPGGPLSTAELYDPATASFVPIEIPEQLQDATNGLAGAVLATLPDGRVVLSGGPRGLLAVFDPGTRSFGSAFAISPQRAFHGAVATGDGVLLAGGCQSVDAGTCNAVPLRSSNEYALDGMSIASGPNLAVDAVAEGAQLIDTGGVFVLVGGFGTAGEAHRFSLADSGAVKLTGLGGQAALLDGGTVLTAFAPDGAAPAGQVAAIAPAGSVVATTGAPPLANIRLIALEDGRVIGIGGDTGLDGEVAKVVDYDPTRDAWSLRAPTVSPSPGAPSGRPGDQPGVLDGPSLARLPDGSVLVVGGEAMPSIGAWLYRPSLVGPTSGSTTATPASTSVGVLTPSDPSTVDRSDGFTLVGDPDTALRARALIGGPRFGHGSVEVTVNVLAGGFALIAQQTAPDQALVARVVPGEPLTIEDRGTVVCSGPPVALPANPVNAVLEVGDTITVRIDDAVAATCDHAATAAGAWGLAAVGAGARISVATVTVAR